MPIKRLSQTSLVSFQKHSNMLAGNQAYIPGSFDLLETTVLGSDAASVAFSNLGDYSSTYKHLQIRATVRTTRTEASDNLRIRFNGQTSTYSWHAIETYAYTSGIFTGAQANSNGSLISNIASANNAANTYGGVVIDILDPFATTKNKTVRGLSGVAVTGGNTIAFRSGAYYSTDSITSIELTSWNSANLVANSRFSLYGIKG